MRIITTAFLLVLLALLQGCSTIKLAYNQAPELAHWYLDSYLNLTSAQSTLVRSELKKVQAWHRQTQLPTYAEELRLLQQKSAPELSTATVCHAFTTGRSQFTVLAQHAEPSVLALATTIDTAQIRHLSSRFDKSNAEYRKEWLEGSVQKRRAKRLKDAVSRAEKIYGNLDDRQIAWLGQRVEASALDLNANYAERLRRQQDLMQTLQTIQTNPAQVQSAMQGFLARSVDSPNPAFRSYIAALTQEQCQTVADLHAQMNPAQKAKAMQVLQGYESDFKLLSAQP